jgi:hypothetical protein
MKNFLIVCAILLLSATTFAQQNQGDCTWAMEHAVKKIKFDPDRYACWYGTDQAEKIYIKGNSILLDPITNQSASGHPKILGPFNPSKTNLIYAFGGNDEVIAQVGRNWIYTGSGKNTVTINSSSYVINESSEGNFFTLLNGATKKNITALKSNDSILYPSENISDTERMDRETKQVLKKYPTNDETDFNLESRMNPSTSECPCGWETEFVSGEGIINDYQKSFCPCEERICYSCDDPDHM